MMRDDIIPGKPTDLLNALAVLGEANVQALTAILKQPLTELHLAHLAHHAAVTHRNDVYKLSPAVANTVLADLERHDLARYRQWHENALNYLMIVAGSGDEQQQLTLLTIFRRLANRLMTDDPKRLPALVANVKSLPLIDETGLAWCTYFEGVGLREVDRYKEAIATFDQLLAQPDLPLEIRARTLNSHAHCCHLMGQLGQALQGYQHSLTLWQQLDNQHYQGLVLLNMGIVAYDLQKYSEAEAYLRQAEKQVSPQWLAGVYNELGLIKRDQGDWVQALTYFEKYITLREAQGAEDRVGRGLNNIGEVLLFQGRLTEALTQFKLALTKMTSQVYQIDVYLYMGLTWQVQGNLVQAETALQQALNLALQIQRRDILAEVHYRLGECLSHTGNPDAALAQFEAGVAVIESIREPLRDEGLKISLLGRWQQIYEALILYCLALGQVAEAFEWAERARARAFADILLSNQVNASDLVRPGEQQGKQVVSLADVQAQLPPNTLLLCYFTTGVMDRHLPFLKRLPPTNLLRSYLLTPARTLLFAVTAQSLTVHFCPLDPNLFATNSPRGQDYTRFLEPAVRQTLYRALVEVANPPPTITKLVIIPHGPLHYVPFETILSPSATVAVTPLLTEPDLVYVPSGAIFVQQRNTTTFNAPALAIGYNGNGLQNGQALRYSEAEAQLVAHLTGGESWVGPQPKKDHLQQTVKMWPWLHFSCHGWFNHQQPLESYLETGEDEHLTALEVMQTWQLPGTLVVLSACQTGVSHILRGDEPLGLIRAFLAVGARAVVVSRWAVEDLPTFLLMHHFYQTLQDDNPKQVRSALSEARCWLRAVTFDQVQAILTETKVANLDDLDLPSTAHPFEHPRHWSAFALMGEA